MKLCDFLTLILSHHGEMIRTLAGLMPEWELDQEALLEALENAQEQEEEISSQSSSPGKSQRAATVKSYQKIAHTVSSLKLPEWLEFYLWSYAPYRKWIQSNLDLDAPFEDAQAIEHVCTYGEKWVHRLGFPSDKTRTLENLARDRWLKFRTEALRSSGRRPLQSV
jgi:hypothetical protein